jgi:prepilin-type processing-associated H-X9-DG protein
MVMGGVDLAFRRLDTTEYEFLLASLFPQRSPMIWHPDTLFLSPGRLAWTAAKSLAFAAFALVFSHSGWGEDPPDRYGDIPSDSIAVFSIDMKAMRESKEGELIPWEIANVACKEQLGFPLDQVDSVDVTVGMPSPMPEVGFSIRFNENMDIADLADSMASPVQVSPKDESLRFRELIEFPKIRVTQKEDRRVLVGTEGTLRRMMSQRIQTGGPTVQLVQGSEAPIRMALNFAKIRDVANAAYEQAAPTIPESIQDDIADMISLIENVLVEVRPMSAEALNVSVGASSGPNADSLMDSMNHLRSEGVRMMREGIETEVNRDASMSDAMREAIASYSERMQGVIESEELWTVEDDRIHLKVANSMMSNYGTIGVMTGLLLPAVQAAREAARRMSSSNNLKQIALGLLNYESAYKKFPPRIGKSADGKPLLSWRVKILPFLEEQALYNEFHLDEPWDSEHNIKLLERMPAVYANPRVVTLPGHTAYLLPYGEDTGWPEDAFRMPNITDGTSNTVAVVEAGGEVAVPWTKPDDLDIDAYPDGSWMPPGAGANVVMFDGSVRFLAALIDPETLGALFTKDGGESVMLP